MPVCTHENEVGHRLRGGRQHHLQLLETCVEQLGDNWLIYASDYPHWDSDFPGTVAEVRRLTAGLGDDVTAKLLGGNASRLYNL